MKLKYVLLFVLIAVSFFYIDNVSAETFFDTIDNKYYIVHKWVGNSSGSGNNFYYVGIFNNKPTIENQTITDTIENITYYKVSTDYNKLISFLETGDTSKVNQTTTTNNSMKLNTDSSYMLYSNFDLIDEDGNLYFAKNEYESQFAENEIYIYDDWFKGVLKYDTINKAIYVKKITESDYTLLFNYTKEYFVIQYLFGGLTFAESDISPIYFSSNTSCSYNSEGFTCYSDSSGNIGRNDFMHTYQYNLNEKTLSRNLPFGAYSSKRLKSNTNIYSLDDNSLIFEKNVIDATTPTISITKEKETSVTILEKEYITDVTLKIDYGTIDNNNYLYMYKYGSDSEWSTITLTENTYFTKTYSENNTLYAQVVSKEDYSVVASSTFEVSSINYDSTPYITIDEYTMDNCIVNDIKICTGLRINSHIVDFKKYSFIVLNNTAGTSAKFNKQTINYPVYENANIEVRIIDNITKEIVDVKGYSITLIPEEVGGIGQYITKKCEISDIGQVYTCLYYIYNYDNSLYDYYYGTSKSSYELIDNSILSIVPSINNSVIYKKQYTEDTKVYFKIVEKSTGDIVYTKEFNITYSNEMEEYKDEIDKTFWDTFRDSIEYFIEPLREIFNMITSFFNGLPVEVQYAFYVAFIFSILYYLSKFIL